jgi:hypothetical protein
MKIVTDFCLGMNFGTVCACVCVCGGGYWNKETEPTRMEDFCHFMWMTYCDLPS